MIIGTRTLVQDDIEADMVGVPRSGGCHTCRRRRIRCDQNKPGCQRCQTDGKICEGYVRYNTFVNKTAGGIQKRQRLEEAIIPAQPPQLLPQRYPPASASILPLPNPGFAQQHHQSLESLPPVPWDQTDKSLLTNFLNIYQPTDPRNRSGVTILWLNEACSLTGPEPALRIALHALASNRVAAANGDDDLAQVGRQSYGKALQTLNELIASPETIFDNQALAAVRCLMIYELFESSTKSVHAWSSHQNGLVRLVQQRGPEGFATRLGQMLLTDTRGVNMIATIQHSVHSPLGGKDWRLNTGVTNLASAEHKLHDLAFDLADIYERDDIVKASGNHNLEHNLSIIREIDSIASALGSLIEDITKLRPAQVVDDVARFWDIESALHVANTLTLILDASVTIREIWDRICEPSPSHAAVAGRYNIQKDEEIGERIIRALKYTTAPDMGLYGSQKSLFALRLSLHQLPRRGPLHEAAKDMYEMLMSRQGLRHTLDLNKQWGVLSSEDAEDEE